MPKKKVAEPKLTKEQIAQHMKARGEAEKGKKLVREILYPILLEHATTIANAERMTEVFKTVIMLVQQKPFKDKTIGDLDFTDEIAQDDEKSRPVFESFIEGFKDVPITDAVKILHEFGGGINAYFDNESRTRDFKSLTIEDLIGK